MRRARVWVAALWMCALLAGAPAIGAQEAAGASQSGGSAERGPGGGRQGQFAGMTRAMGEVTAVNGATVTLRAGDGSTVQVVTTDNTRVMKDRGPVKVSDLHVGDGVMAAGILDAPNKTLHAAVLFAEDAAQVKAMRENLGKTYITGRVKAVNLDDAKMTVERADHVAQTIGFDEGTSFKRAVRHGEGRSGPGGSGSRGEGAEGGSGGESGRGPGGGGFGPGMGGMALADGIDRAFAQGESITLADIKVGDYIAATGAVKGGVFVPVHLVDSPPRPRRERGGGEAGAPGAGGNAGPGER